MAVTRYVCGEQLEIPVGTLLSRNAGCLKVVSDGTSFIKDLCDMIPKHQSAFDAALPALRAANDGILDGSVPGVMGAVLQAELIWDDLLEGGARRIIELLLKCGISETNELQLKMIAMPGPMPEYPDPSAPGMTAAMMQTLCMRVAFYKLIDVIRKADISIEAKMACKSDMNGILTFAWDGIHDWRA